MRTLIDKIMEETNLLLFSVLDEMGLSENIKSGVMNTAALPLAAMHFVEAV